MANERIIKMGGRVWYCCLQAFLRFLFFFFFFFWPVHVRGIQKRRWIGSMRKIMHNLYSYIFEIFRDTIKFVRERSIFFFSIIWRRIHRRICYYSRWLTGRKIANMDKCIFVNVNGFLYVGFSIDLFSHFLSYHFYASPRFRSLFYCCLLLQFADSVYYSYWYEFVEKHSDITIFIRVKCYSISIKKKIYNIFRVLFSILQKITRNFNYRFIHLIKIYRSSLPHLLIFSFIYLLQLILFIKISNSNN